MEKLANFLSKLPGWPGLVFKIVLVVPIAFELYDYIKKQYENAQNDDGTVKDPLILDLDGDGIETTGIDDAQTAFDHDKNGFAELTTWAAEDDGVLAMAA